MNNYPMAELPEGWGNPHLVSLSRGYLGGNSHRMVNGILKAGYGKASSEACTPAANQLAGEKGKISRAHGR